MKSETAKMIVNVLSLDAQCKNLRSAMPGIDQMAEAFVADCVRECLVENAMNAPTPNAPRVTHEFEPVPDPAQTETSEPSKTSLPDYSEYQDHVRTLENSGATLFDDAAGRDDKVQSIRDARKALDSILGILKRF